MTDSLFDVSADTDVDAELLMERIRERVANRQAAISQEAVSQPDLAPVPPSANRALSAQMDFNQAVMGALGAIGQGLQALQERMVEVELRAKDDLQQDRGANKTMVEEIGRLSDLLQGLDERVELVSTRSLGLEETVGHQYEALRQSRQSDLARIDEAMRLETDRAQRAGEALSSELKRLAASVEGASQQSESLASRLLVLEQELRVAIQNVEPNLQATLAAAETRTEDRWAEMKRDVELLNTQGMAQQSAALEHVTSRVDGLGDRAGEIEAAVFSQIDELRVQVDGLGSSSQGLDEKISRELDEVRIRLLRAERRTQPSAHRPSTSGLFLPDHGSDSTATVPDISEATPGDSFDYFLFENHFRGSRSEIKRRQERYVSLFLGRDSVLDLGCGRGEFLELLGEHGVPAKGVDLSEDMVAFCQDRGLQVVLADAFQYLEQLADFSVDGIASFQVVEHLTPEQIIRLIALCGMKLRSTAPIVIETPNPACPAAMGNFYLDPSHIRPVPSDMLGYMLERGPFTVECLSFSAPVGGSNVPLTLEVATGTPPNATEYQDYALIARHR